MSFAPSTKKHDRKLIEYKDKAKLILGPGLIDKIDYFHKRVKADEWSGILIYKIVAGSIEDLENLVLEAVDFIPMDIGNATYTEYEFDANDVYSSNKLMDAMEAGYKLGHIHTHHNMRCFFSGTDTDELYENAPNHNFYLSLIVNFQNFTQWCAAIAFCTEETVSGTISRVGTLTKTKKWKGSNGALEEESETEVNEPIVINDTKAFLHKIDLDMETALDERDLQILELMKQVDALKAAKGDFTESAFIGRVDELFEKKNAKSLYRSPGFSYSHNSSSIHNDDTYYNPLKPNGGKNKKKGGAGNQQTFPFKETEGQEEKKEKRLELMRGEGIEGDDYNITEIRDINCFTPAKVRPFLCKLLDCPADMTLDNAVKDFKTHSQNPHMFEWILGQIEDTFEEKANKHFGINADDADLHCIAISCIDLLFPYKRSGDTDIKLLVDAIDVHTSDKIHDIIVEKLTGIVFNPSTSEIVD